MRSILLTKQMRGTRYLSAWRQTVSDCGCTPATASKAAAAAAGTRREGAAPGGARAGGGGEAGRGAGEHAQRALDLGREVDVAGGVDDVDPVVLPEAGGRGRGDRDPPL